MIKMPFHFSKAIHKEPTEPKASIVFLMIETQSLGVEFRKVHCSVVTRGHL